MTRITAIKAMQLKEGHTLIRIDTNAGVSGYGECGAVGPVARAVIAAYNGAGRLPHLSLIGKDPLQIQVHFHNMFYAYPAARPPDARAGRNRHGAVGPRGQNSQPACLIKNGRMQVCTGTGLGTELDQEYLKANRADGEPWWG